LRVRLCQAADVLDIALLDHLVVGDSAPAEEVARNDPKSDLLTPQSCFAIAPS